LIDKNVFKIRADVKYQLLIFSSIYGALQLFFKTKYEDGGRGKNEGRGRGKEQRKKMGSERK
jgi:hypothetical protein